MEEADRGRPFFLYVAFNAPHWPLEAWPEDIGRYRGRNRAGWDELRRRRLARQIELGLFPAGTQLAPRHAESYPWEKETNKDNMDLRMAVYAAMIAPWGGSWSRCGGQAGKRTRWCCFSATTGPAPSRT